MVIEDYLPIELGSSYIILEIQWLSTLGTVRINWKTLVMKIPMGKNTVILKGEDGLTRSSVSLKSMMRTLAIRGRHDCGAVSGAS